MINLNDASKLYFFVLQVGRPKTEDRSWFKPRYWPSLY